MPSITLSSPLGNLTLTSNTRALTALDFTPLAPLSLASLDQPVLRQGYEELMAYFRGELRLFRTPCTPEGGTPFQREVWSALQTIPFGECASYKEIAQRIGRPRAMRAVGNANNKNPLAIFIPCHRVIGANGALVGYASGLDKKRFLLELEGYLPSSKSI